MAHGEDAGGAAIIYCAAVRLLAAGPLDTWHYLQRIPQPPEIALRSSVQLLHLLYVANIKRQQRRLQLRHWQLQPLRTEDAIAEFIASGMDANTAEEEEVQLERQRQQIGEVDFALFQNDAINSNLQLLNHEFALWLRLQRGPEVDSILQQLQQRIAALLRINTERPRRSIRHQHQRQHRAAGSETSAPATRSSPPLRYDDGASAAAPASAAHAASVIAAAAARATTTRRSARQRVEGPSARDNSFPGSVRRISGRPLFRAGLATNAPPQPLLDLNLSPAVDVAAERTAESLEREAALYADGNGVGLPGYLLRSSILRLSLASAGGAGAVLRLEIVGETNPQAALPNISSEEAADAAIVAAAEAAAHLASMSRFEHNLIPLRGCDIPMFSLMAHPFLLTGVSKVNMFRRQLALEQQQQVSSFVQLLLLAHTNVEIRV